MKSFIPLRREKSTSLETGSQDDLVSGEEEGGPGQAGRLPYLSARGSGRLRTGRGEDQGQGAVPRLQVQVKWKEKVARGVTEAINGG